MNAGITLLSPDLVVHPGATIKEALEEKHMTEKELAVRTNYSVKYISEIINVKKDISNNFAYSLEIALGIDASFWINLQRIYDKEMIKLKLLSD